MTDNLYDTVCECNCKHNCPPGGCTRDVWYNFAAEGKSPSNDEITKAIIDEVKYGKKTNQYPCHELFGRDAKKLLRFIKEHEKELASFHDRLMEVQGPFRFIEDPETDPWIQKQQIILNEVKDFVERNLK